MSRATSFTGAASVERNLKSLLPASPPSSESKSVKSLSEAKLAVIGLGYVGLPLAVEFGKQRWALGFDINTSRLSYGFISIIKQIVFYLESHPN